MMPSTPRVLRVLAPSLAAAALAGTASAQQFTYSPSTIPGTPKASRPLMSTTTATWICSSPMVRGSLRLAHRGCRAW
ncbi:MAG: hypothetical protein ACYTFV_02345 [Planctomycetota bacterium]